jgi:hypothetical protein
MLNNFIPSVVMLSSILQSGTMLSVVILTSLGMALLPALLAFTKMGINQSQD